MIYVSEKFWKIFAELNTAQICARADRTHTEPSTAVLVWAGTGRDAEPNERIAWPLLRSLAERRLGWDMGRVS